jgi:hypothetical protein
LVTVHPVISHADSRKFLRTCSAIYAAPMVWRPRDIRPFIAESDYKAAGEVVHYVAVSEDKTVGRISVHVHPGRPEGLFGLFECQADAEVARHLLSTAEDWLRSKGCTHAIGPIDPSAVVSGGVLTKGSTPNAEQMPFTGVWHADLLKNLGWSHLQAFQTWCFEPKIPKQVRQMSSAVAQKPGLKVVPLGDLKRSDSLDILTQIYNASYKGTFGFVPVSAQDLGVWLGFPDRVDPSTSLVAFVDEAPAAFAITMIERTALSNTGSSLSQTVQRILLERRFTPDRLRVALFGVLPEFRGSALGGLSLHMYVKLTQAMIERRITSGILTWTAAHDEITAAGLSLIGAVPEHTYEIFSREL